MNQARFTRLIREINKLKEKTKRSEVAGAVERKDLADFPTGAQVEGRMLFQKDGAQADGTTGSFVFDDGNNWLDVLFVYNVIYMPSYTVATLPAPNGNDYATAIATDGRKAGEGAGAGTGIPVWYDGTNWRTFYDNTVAVA